MSTCQSNYERVFSTSSFACATPKSLGTPAQDDCSSAPCLANADNHRYCPLSTYLEPSNLVAIDQIVLTHSSADISYEENCAVLLTKIPGDTTFSELFETLVTHRSLGKIAHVYIFSIDPTNHSKMARLVFTKPEPARRLRQISRSPTKFYVKGAKVKVHACLEYPAGRAHDNDEESRVLIPTGPM